MWALPPDLARLKVALPEGLLLLPHHYATADRERLLTLYLRAADTLAGLLIERSALDQALDMSAGDTPRLQKRRAQESGTFASAVMKRLRMAAVIQNKESRTKASHFRADPTMIRSVSMRK